uniref:Uncharacterized protein n=1 Tax=Arundo donax TaxID=35708 RepID=A0A0A8XV41_ARUDO
MIEGVSFISFQRILESKLTNSYMYYLWLLPELDFKYCSVGVFATNGQEMG